MSTLRARAVRSVHDRAACWHATRELEAHHVWSLPDDSELPQPDVITIDGIGLTVEAWDGSRYRTYQFGNPDNQPAPEARDAEWMLRQVIELVARASRPSP